MKIAYITTYDPSSILNWSGTGLNMARALEDQGFDLDYISHLYESNKFFLNVKKAYYKFFKNETFYRERQPSVVKDFARQIDLKLSGSNPDVLFSPGSIPVAELENDAPVIFWTDTSFQGLVDYNPRFMGLCQETLENGHRMEQKALDNCSLAIYSSQWAADTALKHYDVDPAKIKIVPFGANIVVDRDRDDIEQIIASKDTSRCEILFLGVDWKLKGGDMVMAVANMLHKNGIPVRVTIIGCDPPKEVAESPLTEVHGFLDKHQPQGMATLNDRIRRAHFLMVPSLTECFGIVYCEANSFGVPNIARLTGGVGDAVKSGINGMTFHMDAGPEAYCAFIETYFKDPSKYRDLALSSFNEFEQRLNWASSGKIVRSYIEEIVR